VSGRAWIAIALASAGTLVLRASFLIFAGRLVDLPPLTQRILRQIPPAVLAALVVPSLVRPAGSVDLWQPRLLAGVVAAAVSWRTRNVGLTLVVGMAVLVAVQQLT
jgi:branched-subunit amino acid transport protein